MLMNAMKDLMGVIKFVPIQMDHLNAVVSQNLNYYLIREDAMVHVLGI